MLDLKYGVKYPFPHSIVHIIDNSMYNGTLPVVTADDPSIYATIVVCGTPMGEDNKMVTINRSDVANVAYGLGSLDASTIKKYGQAITYVNSLINQNVPVKFMRVTPDDAAYGSAIITVQWRVDTEDNKIHVRFKNANWPASLDRSRFKNTSRINDALITALNGTVSEDGYTWKQRAFINVIPAGKGSVYNNMSFAINMSNQSKKPANVRYVFSTIDSRTSQTVETFGGSLVNIDNADRIDAIATVNTQVARRIEGSSILVPYVNEGAVQELYKDYITLLNNNIEAGIADDYAKRVAVSVNVNTFDVIYGNYIYNGTDASVKLPYYQVDTINTDIIKLGSDYLVDSLVVTNIDQSVTDYGKSTFETKVIDMSTGLTNVNDSVHVGDLYLSTNANSKQLPKISIVAAVNQYTGTVTSMTIPKVFPLTKVTSSGTSMYLIDPNAESKNIAVVIDELIDAADLSTAVQYNTLSTKYSDLLAFVLSGTVAVGDVVAGTDGSIFELYYVEKCNITGGGSNVSITLVKYDAFNIYYGLDRNSHKNLVKGTGNVMAWDYENTTGITWPPYIPAGYTDAAYSLIGYTVIKGAAATSLTDLGTVEVVVNNYDGESTIKIQNGSFKFGNVPTSVTLNTDAVGTLYDVLSYDPASVDTFRINNLGEITNGTKTYAVGDVVSVVIDEASDTPKQFDPSQAVVISGGTSTGSLIYSVLPEDVTDEFPAYDTDGNLIFFAGFDPTETTVTEKYTDQIDPADLSTAWAYVDGNNTTDLYIVSNGVLVTTSFINYATADGVSVIPTTAHTILKITEVDGDGNIVAYDIVRRTAISNNKGDSSVEGYDLAGIFTGEFPLVTINGYDGSVATDYATTVVTEFDVIAANASPASIVRYYISGSLGTLFRITVDSIEIPANYYNESEYGISLDSENGGVPITGGSTGFFDDENINSIEYKWKYSALLTRAFKGELDKRIMSPVRCPAKYLFDAAYNTIVGANIVPELIYTPEEIINASTIFTEEEKEAILFDKSLLAGIGNSTADIDVKAAMYELMDYRVFQGIPDHMRPLGQGSGLSLHLDSGVVDDNTAKLVENSFNKRFSTYNASWDVGGYVDAATGLPFTFTKRLVDGMFSHMQTYTVNKPYTGQYAVIPRDEYISYFPDIDMIDWEKRSETYTAGGNSWIVDINGNLSRRSQRTLYRAGDTSDLVQENNARTLSQLVYLLQNKIDTYILEYADDDTLKTMTDDCNIMFSNWVGNQVDYLDISFEKDTNPTDGGEIVVCYVEVRFRSLVLRVPIIVDVQRRTN